MAPLLIDLGYSRHPGCAKFTPLEQNERDKAANAALLKPVRPYTQDGVASAGWSGTDTSKDGEPLRAESQKQALAVLQEAGYVGATVVDVRHITGMHHGMASGALSVLHKRGYLVRLTQKRDRCRIYVVADLCHGRDAD
jgi:hypothetical protein